MNETVFSLILDNFNQLSIEQISILKEKINNIETNSSNAILSEDELNVLHDLFSNTNHR